MSLKDLSEHMNEFLFESNLFLWRKTRENDPPDVTRASGHDVMNNNKLS